MKILEQLDFAHSAKPYYRMLRTIEGNLCNRCEAYHHIMGNVLYSTCLRLAFA